MLAGGVLFGGLVENLLHHVLQQPLIFKPTHASFRGSRNSFSKKLGYEPKYRIPKLFCREIDAPSFDTTKRFIYIYTHTHSVNFEFSSSLFSLLSFRLAPVVASATTEENLSLGENLIQSFLLKSLVAL